MTRTTLLAELVVFRRILSRLVGRLCQWVRTQEQPVKEPDSVSDVVLAVVVRVHGVLTAILRVTKEEFLEDCQSIPDVVLAVFVDVAATEVERGQVVSHVLIAAKLGFVSLTLFEESRDFGVTVGNIAFVIRPGRLATETHELPDPVALDTARMGRFRVVATTTAMVEEFGNGAVTLVVLATSALTLLVDELRARSTPLVARRRLVAATALQTVRKEPVDATTAMALRFPLALLRVSAVLDAKPHPFLDVLQTRGIETSRTLGTANATPHRRTLAQTLLQPVKDAQAADNGTPALVDAAREKTTGPVDAAAPTGAIGAVTALETGLLEISRPLVAGLGVPTQLDTKLRKMPGEGLATLGTRDVRWWRVTPFHAGLKGFLGKADTFPGVLAVRFGALLVNFPRERGAALPAARMNRLAKVTTASEEVPPHSSAAIGIAPGLDTARNPGPGPLFATVKATRRRTIFATLKTRLDLVSDPLTTDGGFVPVVDTVPKGANTMVHTAVIAGGGLTVVRDAIREEVGRLQLTSPP